MSMQPRRGTVILTALAMSTVIIAIAWAAVSVQTSRGTEATVQARDEAARSLAEAGLELGVARLDSDRRWVGEKDYGLQEGTIDVEAMPVEGAPDRWRVRSVGRLARADAPTAAACCIALVERLPDGRWVRLCWRWDPDVH